MLDKIKNKHAKQVAYNYIDKLVEYTEDIDVVLGNITLKEKYLKVFPKLKDLSEDCFMFPDNYKKLFKEIEKQYGL